jgi:hypothetical protein
LSGTSPKEVHLHITRIPIAQFPKEKEEISQKCYELFKEKDDLLDYFRSNKHFPRNSKQETGKNNVMAGDEQMQDS